MGAHWQYISNLLVNVYRNQISIFLPSHTATYKITSFEIIIVQCYRKKWHYLPLGLISAFKILRLFHFCTNRLGVSYLIFLTFFSHYINNCVTECFFVRGNSEVTNNSHVDLKQRQNMFMLLKIPLHIDATMRLVISEKR